MKGERDKEREENRLEKQDLNSKMDKLLQLTQKERLGQEINKQDVKTYITEIENLKKELATQRQIN